MNKSLYEKDFNLWIKKNIQALLKKNVNQIDFINIAEELQGISNCEKRELRKCLTYLIANILKWVYQPKYRNLELVQNIKKLQREIKMILSYSPSFKSEIIIFCNMDYKDSVEIAMEESRLPIETFPNTFNLTRFEILKKIYELNA